VAINRNREDMRQSTDKGRRPTTLDAAEDGGTATTTATATATATEANGKHWVAGGVASGGGGNGISLWSYSAMGEYNFSDYSKLAQKLSYFFPIHVLGDESFYVFGRWWGQLIRMYISRIPVKLDWSLSGPLWN
jgi:hypothetical protein